MSYYPNEHLEKPTAGTTVALWFVILAVAGAAYLYYLDAGCDTVGIMTEAGKICF